MDRFNGENAVISVGNIPESQTFTIPAREFPSFFVISYSVAADSELEFMIDEIRAIPRAATSKCVRPTITPLP